MNLKKINPALRRQIGQLSNEIPEKNLETAGFSQNDQVTESEQGPDLAAISQLKTEKDAFAKKRLEEIRMQMQTLAHQRQEQIRQRYQQKNEEQKRKEAEQQGAQKNQPLETSSKPKKGMPFWGKRVKTAQQQSQPETAGRRTSG
ncbi:MAG: hypothetical protein NT052_00340 [Candidatus Shapirobacteria bacterium]|nr:hypothetical protein [Candidatus Shapirobacteria bacterium]